MSFSHCIHICSWSELGKCKLGCNYPAEL